MTVLMDDDCNQGKDEYSDSTGSYIRRTRCVVITDAQTKSVCALSYIFLLEYSSVYSRS